MGVEFEPLVPTSAAPDFKAGASSQPHTMEEQSKKQFTDKQDVSKDCVSTSSLERSTGINGNLQLLVGSWHLLPESVRGLIVAILEHYRSKL